MTDSDGGDRERLRARAGMTLIELVLVMVMMGAMLTIAMPRINFRRMRMESSLRTVTMTLLSAQRMAIQRQHNVVVGIDSVNSVLRVHMDEDNDLTIDAREAVNYVKLEDGVQVRRGGAPARAIGGAAVTFTTTESGLPVVVFGRAGNASEIGGFYLSSVGSGGGSGSLATDTWAIEVERATGRARRYSYDNGAWQQRF